MDGGLPKMKALISGILISAKGSLNRERLVKDYLDIEGASLPETFKRLGYKNWSDPRLISDFGDTFFCNGNTVYAVQKGRTELSMMIAKTKTKSKSKNKGPASLQQVAGRPSGVSATPKYNRGSRGRGRNLTSQKPVPIRSSSIVKTHKNTNNNQVKTYSNPQPSNTIECLIPKRGKMREDPYKVTIRESQKISMERGNERNNLSDQIEMLGEDRSRVIPSKTELALYDEIDLEKSTRLNRLLTKQRLKYKLVKLLLRHSRGITHQDLHRAYVYAYDADDTDLVSMNYSFTSTEFCQQICRNSIAFIDSQDNRLDNNNQHFYQGTKNRAIFSLFLKVIKLCKKNGQKPEAFFKLARKVTIRLFGLLSVYQHGIFVKDIENVYEEIYGEKMVEIPNLNVSSYLESIPGFNLGFSIIDRKEQFVMADEAILNENFIEIDGETDFYANEHSNTAEFDCDFMMNIVFQKLYEEKRIIVIPISEIGCYFQRTFQKPLVHNGTINDFINKLENFVIKEKVQLSNGCFRSVLVQKTMKHTDIFNRIPIDHNWSADDESASEVSIGHLDAARGRIHVMSAFTDDDRERYTELAKLSADMDRRYQIRTLKMDRFNDDEVINYSNVAAKFLKGWGRAEIRSVDPANRSCRVYAVDYGETENVCFENLRKLPEKFRRKLPEQLDTVYLSELNGERINQQTRNEIHKMIEQKNIFKVSVTGRRGSCMEVSFTHRQTGTYFGGNMTLVNAQYKRKLTTIFEDEDVIYHDSINSFYILNFSIATDRVVLVIKGDDKADYRSVYITNYHLNKFINIHEKASYIQIRLVIKKWERESKLVQKFGLPIDSNREMIRNKLSLPDDVHLNGVYQLAEIVNLIEEDRIVRPDRTPIGNCLITLQKCYQSHMGVSSNQDEESSDCSIPSLDSD